MGFYSAAAEAASKFPQRAPIDQIINKIKGQPNVKKEELDNANLADAFAGQRSVDPKEVARHLQKSLPQISETIYGQYKYKPQKMSIPSFNKFDDAEEVHRLHGPSDRADMFIGAHGTSGEPEYGVYDSSGRLHSMHEDFDEAIAAANEHLGAETRPAVYSQYTIPGGENYREVVMHLPENEVPYYENFESWFKDNFKPSNPTAEAYSRDYAKKQWDAAQGKIPNYKGANDYLSSHWDESNVLAHLRMSDRDNGKTLHLEELQSDWGQEGRKKGFGEDKIPIGPYVTDTNQWVDLGLKRALMEAAKGGYDKLIWTPGAEQAARYDLSKHIDELYHWRDGEKIGLSAYGPNGTVLDQHYVSPSELDNVVGKDLAKDILEGAGDIAHDQPEGVKVIRGEDLKIGGEGMKSFYDKLVPQRLNKIIAQYDKDVKVAPHSHSLKGEEGEVKAHAIQITPKLREAILKGGLPAFEKGGSVIDAALDVVSKLRR